MDPVSQRLHSAPDRERSTPCCAKGQSGSMRIFWNFYVTMLGATLPGDIPDIVPVLVEDEGRVGLGDPPGALFDLMLELVRSPASVAEGDEDLCRPSLVADVLQDRDARRNRKAIRDGDGLRPTVIGTVYHEAHL